jgi:filamentous hemagglutinin
MNKNRYKLVFSKVLNMLVPVSEAASGVAAKNQRRLRGATWGMFKILIGMSIVNTAWGDTPLPAGISIRSIVGDSTRVIASDANKIHFEQLAPRAIVDFNQLNLQKGQQFNVNMQSNWSMLNRIHDANPSLLNGQVNAAGNLYFINSNGLIIGRDAQFNVGSLYAGSLDITNQLFQDGFINEQTFTNPFSLVATLDLTPEARQRVQNAEVLVESGARINAANNGKVMLFAPNVKVEDNAIIRTPEGQTILAAGERIWLRGSADPAGFLVEVDAGGTATNLGQLIAERGNVSMMGLAVNQLGNVSASTSVRANGSIRLIAQDRVNVVGVNVTGSRNGVVTLGKDSVTEVRPELNDREETIVSQPFKTSEVLIEASMINIDGAINAKGGNVTAKAEFDVSPLVATRGENAFNNGATRRIMLGSNASIDVSGVDAVAPMSRNELEVQLFSDQLKDAPILRDSDLFRSTVFVDARKGTSLFDIQPFLDLRPATVAERMTNAGRVNLATNQELIIAQGSTINVSGGSTTYTEGTIRESQLSFNGQLVPISEALPGVPYTKNADNFTRIDPRWGTTTNIAIGGSSTFVPSYFEGANAGTVNLTTPIDVDRTNALVLSGNLLAATRTSREQLINQTKPLGGELIASSRNLTIDRASMTLPSQFNFTDALPNANNFSSIINTDFLSNGFNRIDLSKADQVTINQDLNLASYGTLNIGNPTANAITRLNANIIAPNSNVSLQSLATEVADNVTISTAGRFTNDRPGVRGSLSTVVAKNGGNILLGNTTFGDNVTLDASAGAAVNFLGNLQTGLAGNITFSTYDALPDNLNLRSFGFNRGGELSITFGDNAIKRNLFVGSNLAQEAGDIGLQTDFFREGGFSKYQLKAFNVTIGDSQAPDQTLYTSMQNWRMNSGFLNLSGTQSMGNVATPVTLPSFSRQASALWFESPTSPIEESVTNLGTVTLAENTTLRTDIGGSVTMRAGKQVNVLGDIDTPSGTIELSINDVNADIDELPNQMVFIGESANLSARGSTITLPDSRPNILNNRVLSAGTISINARQAALLKGAVVMKEGAVLDVSGVSIANDTRTSRGIVRETLFGDAGTININGTGSLLLDGSFAASAAGTGRAGSLNLLFNPFPFSDQQAFPHNSGQFLVTQQKQLSAENLNVGDALKNNTLPPTAEATQRLKAQISVDQVEEAGFANVAIRNYLDIPGPSSRLVLSDDVSLNIGGNLLIDSPVTQVSNQGNVSLTAGHITLRSPNQSINQTLLNNATNLADSGTLTFNANQIYFDGVTTLGGINQANLNSQFDISGQGVRSAVQLGNVATDGGLLSHGKINLTARQIYPESGGSLNFRALGTSSQINVNASQQAAQPILSAGGVLNLQASTIQQNGVLSAPFGVINFIGDEVSLGSNSVTSVSANNAIIPFGVTTTAGEVFNPSQGRTRPLIASEINLQANNIDLQAGASLDLSAGGDMFAFEWIPGLGGSTDILAQPNTFAVIPNFNQVFAPRDLNMSQSSAPTMVGKTVFLSGGNGLASGEYTLLPARYALVPGAFVVQLKPTNTLLPGQTLPQPDGSILTTGVFGDFSTGARDAQFSTFSVFSGALFRPAAGEVLKAPSQYALTSASTFFTDPAKTEGSTFFTPKDVAKLSLNASQLSLEANVIANTTQGGRGLLVDIGANNIRIVNNKDNTDSQSLQIQTSELNQLGAQSLLLGGTRSTNQQGQLEIDTVANTVSIENDAEQVINTPELIATARDRITVADGAVINTGKALANAPTSDLLASGDGAVLALSSTQKINYNRENASPNAVRGELLIGNQSTLLAGVSAILDATNNVSLDGRLNVQEQGSVTLGANRILVGDAPSDVRGLKVNNETIATFGNLSSLTLNSYSNLDTYGSVNLGGQDLNLTINAAGIVGNAGVASSDENSVVITANQLTVRNTQNAILENANHAAANLTLNANTIQFEGKANPNLVAGNLADTDKFNIQGYSQLNLNARDIRTSLNGEANFNVQDVNMSVGRIGAESGSDYTLRSAGRLQTTQATPTAPLANDVLAGRLTMSADNLVIGSRVESASGTVTLRANNDLRLTDGANVSANAQAIAFADVTRAIPAGQVNLVADNGNITIDQGALVRVNAVGNTGAGELNIEATRGALNLAGRLEGLNTASNPGASLSVDVQTLTDLSAANSTIAGFNASRDYRIRQGDVTINQNGEQALSAQKIKVTADNGQILVTGEITTNSPANGSIGLFAQNGITLTETAKLDASSSSAGAKGGRIDLHTINGVLDLQSDADIVLNGGEGGRGGVLHLRAPRTGDDAGNDVGVTQLSSNIVGSEQTVLEAFRVFENVSSLTTGNGTGSALGFNTVADDVSGFMANRDTIISFLGKTDDPTFVLRAGTEIRSGGDLTIGSSALDWNLFPTVVNRSPADAGVLTLRAENNLLFNGSLSDGFTTANRNLITTDVAGLLTDHTWSYRLVAGADTQSANVLNTLASPILNGNASHGNLVVANDKVIRTGTGFIDIATGGDLRLSNLGSVIYTAGRLADPLPEFTMPPAVQNPLYLADGGDINIQSRGSVVGAEVNNGRQMVNQWLFRQGGGLANRDTSWWVRPDQFRQGIATLGGGNINVNAGLDVRNFSASTPTTARFDNFSTANNPASGNRSVTGGGDLTVTAGGNIVNGTFFVAGGEGRLTAGGSIEPNSGGLGTVLALQDGRFDVTANENVYISTTFNPTLVNQSSVNANPGDTSGLNSNFNSFSARAGVNVMSTSGNVGYGTGDDVFARNAGLYNNSGLALFFGVNPSKIDLTSFSGDVTFGRPGSLNNLVMLPATDGQLSLLAANNVTLGNTKMSDADPNILPGINNPLNLAVVNVFNRLIDTHSSSLLHRNNIEPALIIADKGDVQSDNRVVTIPKATRVIAGQDITNINIGLQNNRTSDVSLIKAGRDVNTRNIAIAGPGELLVQAGRNVDLIYPEITTVNSTGNGGTRNPRFRNTFAEFANPALPASGASITLQAGLGKGANVAGYINQYILPAGTGPAVLADDAQRLSQYRATTSEALTAFMREFSGDQSLNNIEALNLFTQQSLETQTIFANRHLTSELIASGRDFAKTGNHERGSDAIEALFPNATDGNILLFNSKVSTNSGGSIDLIAPGGFINVGVPGQGGDIGVITEKGGAIRGIAEGDFLVNQSKVITQFGSDIAIWSSSGTIDAGRGSKTATSIPERIVQTDAFGNTIVEVRGVAAGSGIRAQSYDPDGPNGPLEEPLKGNISLIAPVVDAGEAGIEAGDLLIVAPVVLNAANIQVQGVAAGVPMAASSSIAGVSAGLSPDAVNSATKAVADSVAPSTDNSLQKPKLPSLISVDVISMGEDKE